MTSRRQVDQLDDIEAWNQEDAAELERPKDSKQYEILVSSRDWTVETIVRQIEAGNVDLDPAFQRRNAWRDSRRSRLIESFILGFPVPQIVLAENPRSKGTFIVIDGKQRLLTLAGFFLPEYRDYWTQPRLSGLNVLGDLNKVDVDKFAHEPDYASELRRLKNADIRTTVITGFEGEGVLYDIFYRINTGAVPLSSQELRQVLNRGDFSRYLFAVTEKVNPLWTILGISSPDPRLRDVELLLRLIAWRRFSKDYRGNMKPFLDDAMNRLNKAWDTEQTKTEALVVQLFKGIDAVHKIFGSGAGRKYKDGAFQASLNRALFEVQAYFLSFPSVRTAAIRHSKAMRVAFKKISADVEFARSLESTTKSIENYRTRFSIFRKMLENVTGESPEMLQLGAATKR